MQNILEYIGISKKMRFATKGGDEEQQWYIHWPRNVTYKRTISCVLSTRNNFSYVFSFERSVQKLLLVISAVWVLANYKLSILSLMRVKSFRDSP